MPDIIVIPKKHVSAKCILFFAEMDFNLSMSPFVILINVNGLMRLKYSINFLDKTFTTTKRNTENERNLKITEVISYKSDLITFEIERRESASAKNGRV